MRLLGAGPKEDRKTETLGPIRADPDGPNAPDVEPVMPKGA